MHIIEADPYANVTFTGGDPMYQPEGFTELARAIRQRTDKDIWCYTGFTFEMLINNPRHRALLEQIDEGMTGFDEAQENLNPISEEEGGNLYLINGNMTKLKDAGLFANKQAAEKNGGNNN